MQYIDFHTHIFPDKIAKQAMDALAAESGDYRPRTDGTLQGLLDSMKRANIAASLVANIATKPAQMFPVLEFCKQIEVRRQAAYELSFGRTVGAIVAGRANARE